MEQTIQTICALINQCFTNKTVYCEDDAIRCFAEHCFNAGIIDRRDMMRQFNRHICLLKQLTPFDVETPIRKYISDEMKQIQLVTCLDGQGSRSEFVSFYMPNFERDRRFYPIPDSFIERLIPLFCPQLKFTIHKKYITVAEPELLLSIPIPFYFWISWRRHIDHELQKYMVHNLAAICLEYCQWY